MLRKAVQVGAGTTTAYTARKFIAQLLHGLGRHQAAIVEATAALRAASTDAHRIESLLQRGSYHHTLGEFHAAIKDYQAVLEATPQGAPEGDTIQAMCLAFYQKEIALWAVARQHAPIRGICLDADLHPEFKELWCKKCPPSADFVAMYARIMQPQHPDWTAPQPALPPLDTLRPLLAAADAVGALVQYRHQGFLPNRRHHRMAGLAAIEFGQTLAALASARRQGSTTQVPNAGASVSARSPDPTGHHTFGWRDAMDVIVRWRQAAEPNDQVIWVDLLTEREFTNGFGSHTPLFTGQTRCVRYYSNFERAMRVAKGVMQREGGATDADNVAVDLSSAAAQARVAAATTAKELWQAVGRDAWVVVPIASTSREGHTLEGTRLTVVKLGEKGARAGPGEQPGPDAGSSRLQEVGTDDTGSLAAGVKAMQLASSGAGVIEAAGTDAGDDEEAVDSYEFSIRTPVTPARWKDYDAELDAGFTRLVDALAEKDLPAAADAALRFAYYWYNFMPLARGSAMCGYVFLMGAFLARRRPGTVSHAGGVPNRLGGHP